MKVQNLRISIQTQPKGSVGPAGRRPTMSQFVFGATHSPVLAPLVLQELEELLELAAAL